MSASRDELRANLRAAKRERQRQESRFRRARRKLEEKRAASFTGALSPAAIQRVARLERKWSAIEDVVCGLEKQLLEQWADEAGAE